MVCSVKTNLALSGPMRCGDGTPAPSFILSKTVLGSRGLAQGLWTMGNYFNVTLPSLSSQSSSQNKQG